MITARRLLGQTHKEGFTDVTLSEIQMALAGIDQLVVLQECKNKYRVEVWDRQTPIGGVNPQVFLDRDDVRAIGNGLIMLLYKEQKLIYFQPTDPRHSGFVGMSNDTFEQAAQELILPLAQSDALSQITARVYTLIGL